jgi:SulP family sulfate permease
VADAMTGNVFVFRISGAFFFGATAGISTILDRVGGRPGVFILDFSAVPLIDSTGAKALHGFVHKLQRSGTKIYFSGARPAVQRALMTAGLREPAVTYSDSVAAAQEAVRASGRDT